MWNNQGGGYDQGYGDQGGGYMNSPGFGSPQASQEKKTRQRAQNIMPVTAAQVLAADHQDEKFVLDGIELHQVTLVGLVRAVKEAATRLDYEIDDMTSPPLEVRQFVDNDENTPDEERTVPMRENTYVRVFGHVRAFGGKRSVVAFRMVPLMDMNELSTHLLEVMHSHMQLTRGQMSMNGGGDQTMTAAAPAATSYDGGNQGGGYQGAQGDMNSGLTNIQRQVSMVIKSCHDDQGVSVSFMMDKLRGIPRNSIMEAIDFLSSEGHIYSTIDDEHYKSTDAME